MAINKKLRNIAGGLLTAGMFLLPTKDVYAQGFNPAELPHVLRGYIDYGMESAPAESGLEVIARDMVDREVIASTTTTDTVQDIDGNPIFVGEGFYEMVIEGGVSPGEPIEYRIILKSEGEDGKEVTGIYRLIPKDGELSNFTPGLIEEERFTIDKTVGVDTKHIPSTFSLDQNFPNPFNNTTTIPYSLEKDENVVFEVYNSAGQKVRTLVNEYQQPGRHSVVFDGKDLSSGQYIFRLKSDESDVRTIRGTLVK